MMIAVRMCYEVSIRLFAPWSPAGVHRELVIVEEQREVWSGIAVAVQPPDGPDPKLAEQIMEMTRTYATAS